jgi:type IV pilus assembly protein PilO
MSELTDAVDRMPIWQKLLIMLAGAALIVGGWWFFFYSDVQIAKQGAEQAVTKANTELERVKKRKENFLEEQRKHEQREREFAEKMKVLPMSTSTVDNLMQTFQQRARMVGMSVDSWTNEPEERQDFYARLPIRVKAEGTWAQAGEFFRRVTELEQIVSIENLSLKASDPEEPGDSPPMAIEFEAATYRFLSPEERSAAKDPKRSSGAAKRKGK